MAKRCAVVAVLAAAAYADEQGRQLHGFDHEHGEHHHWHHWHHGGHHEFFADMPQDVRQEMMEAHSCHHSCGVDAACHEKCPNPWKKLVLACQEFPKIQECQKHCQGAECQKCPVFTVDWVQKHFEASPEKVFEMAEEHCPRMEKAYACHQACSPADHECHHKCHGHHHEGHWHHGHDHHEWGAHGHDHHAWGHHGHHVHEHHAWGHHGLEQVHEWGRHGPNYEMPKPQMPMPAAPILTAVETEPETSGFLAMMKVALPKDFSWSKLAEALYDKAVKILSDAASHKFKQLKLDKEILV
eukprot:TRINITY_DN39864_c0_g1_i1.p1 TRINITY_DN39864_c0_g1~~TRINITY_DN39864_c0_g1_i1.p1  ORF type:complete len:298 (+),score=56.49 TRINITY_DN39864_c0_g1_i1:75-968(+)